MGDLLTIVGLTLGSCLAVGLVGAVLLHRGRRRSMRYLLMVATLLPVLAVLAAALVNVGYMFLSAHDAGVILLGLAISAVLAAGGAWWVTQRITTASRAVGLGLSSLVADSAAGRQEDVGSEVRPLVVAAPQELAGLLDELAETRRTLAASRARERAAEDARRELVAFMSHDLRTPLSGLRALAEALEDGLIADVPRALAHLRTTVARMAGLVDDLFALSRVQGSQPVKPAVLVSLTELIDDVAVELGPAAEARQVHLEVEVPDDDRLAVLGSADDLARGLANLVANALQHTDPGLSVRLEAVRSADGHIQVAVADGCGGIPADSLPRVFDTGWRGTPSRGGDDGGAGLGLAITRGVVESHAGSIRVVNVAGGCRFEVQLPPPERTASR
jgi:signal transduction histidine kinase